MLEKGSRPVFVQSERNLIVVPVGSSKGIVGPALDVGTDPFVLRQAPVCFRHGEDFLYVPVGVVVAVQGSIPVLRRSTVFEVAGGRWYGVLGVHYVRDPVAVAVHTRGLPRRGQE